MRWIQSIAGLCLVLACGRGQLSETFFLDFQTTKVCLSETQEISFSNETGSPMIIDGAATSAGTDPEGNFSLEGIRVGGQEVQSVAGTLTNVTIASGASYSFLVDYTPRTEGEHKAVIDVAFSEPIGVIQIHLSGVADGQASGCLSPSLGSPVAFDGDLTLTVTKLVAATSKLSAALSSDQGVRPFDPVPLDLGLDLDGRSVLLPEVSVADKFILPKPKPEVPILGKKMKQDTVITTTGSAAGSYDPSTGALIVRDLVVTLDTDFNTTVTVTLTTEEVSLSNLSQPINSQAIRELGENYDPATKTIFGEKIDAATGEVTLVGTTTIESSTLDPGADDAFKPANLVGATMAVLVQGKIE